MNRSGHNDLGKMLWSRLSAGARLEMRGSVVDYFKSNFDYGAPTIIIIIIVGHTVLESDLG